MFGQRVDSDGLCLLIRINYFKLALFESKYFEISCYILALSEKVTLKGLFILICTIKFLAV